MARASLALLAALCTASLLPAARRDLWRTDLAAATAEAAAAGKPLLIVFRCER